MTFIRWTVATVVGVVAVTVWFSVFALIEVGIGRANPDSTVLTLLVLAVCFGIAIGALALLARMGPRIDDDEPDDED